MTPDNRTKAIDICLSILVILLGAANLIVFLQGDKSLVILQITGAFIFTGLSLYLALRLLNRRK
jgi:hypothetical protein